MSQTEHHSALALWPRVAGGAPPSAPPRRHRGASFPAGLAALATLLAAWCAAGSLGVLADPWRLGLSYLAWLVAATAVWPWDKAARPWYLLVVLGLAVLRTWGDAPPVFDLLTVAAGTAFVALAVRGQPRAVLMTCAVAVLTLAVYRLLVTAVPAAWWCEESAAGWLSRVGGRMGGVPVQAGASFVGLDMLVLTAAWCAVWLGVTRGSGWGRAGAVAAALCGVHLLYLAVLGQAMDLAALLPAAPEASFDHPYEPPSWRWSRELGQSLPWNLPLLSALMHLSLVGSLIRFSRWPAEVEQDGDPEATGPAASHSRRSWRRWAGSTPYVLSILLPVSATFCGMSVDLAGKRFLANRPLGEDRPQYDHYGRSAAGEFGMLPQLVASLGGQWRVATELSDAELAAADAVLLLRPEAPRDPATVTRLWDYVRRGGSLLVAAEPYAELGGLPSGSEAVLGPTAIRLRRDVAVSEMGGWLAGCQWLPHPIRGGARTAGYSGFTDSGCSLRLGWPARPLALGRWGWSDPGSDALLSGVSRYEAGERLGDLVLAAEQRCGRGRIVVLGDAELLTNEGGVRGYERTARLLAYLAQRRGSPQSAWRQVLTVCLAAGLLAALIRRPAGTKLLLAAALWGVAQFGCTWLDACVGRVVPDGRLVRLEGPASSSRLAYIEASHLPPSLRTDWAFDGVNGLALTWMRSGYLTLAMPELSRPRLERAAVLISVAPARAYPSAARRWIREFVEAGGTFFCLVGGEEAAASRRLLNDFGLDVGLFSAWWAARKRRRVGVC